METESYQRWKREILSRNPQEILGSEGERRIDHDGKKYHEVTMEYRFMEYMQLLDEMKVHESVQFEWGKLGLVLQVYKQDDFKFVIYTYELETFMLMEFDQMKDLISYYLGMSDIIDGAEAIDV